MLAIVVGVIMHGFVDATKASEMGMRPEQAPSLHVIFVSDYRHH